MMSTPILRLGAAAVLCISLAGSALAQEQPGNWLTRLFQPPSTSAVPSNGATSASAGSREWSGQSGASGDPRMTADAIRAAAADFGNCLAALWPQAAARGITQANYQRFTAGLTPDLRIMDLLDAQPEFTKAPWDYLDTLVSDERIARGRELLAQYGSVFAAVERDFGVDRHIIAAIWGVESNYGTMGGDRPVLRSTATLACIGRRRDFFREEFLAALEILQRGDVPPDRLVGSWAGAFGPTQFMPTSFKRYAVDFDGDGRRDVVDSIPDVIASTANNLKTDGWVRGETWGYEVLLPANFNYLYADLARQLTLGQWRALNVVRAGGKPFPHPAARAFLLLPAGAHGPAFLMLHNFRVIMKYNPAEAYALAIGHLADRLGGGGPLVQAWPRDERVLSITERYELQQRLERRGYSIGEPDGLLGPRTRAAIRSFQVATGQTPDGYPSSLVLDRLRQP
jgi:membrane-bound lytic murein transglycosylase B